MNNSEDNSLLLFVGGILAIFVVAGVAMKAIANFFYNLKVAFENFGHMVAAFFPMLANCLLVIAVIAAIITTLWVSISFCINHHKMIKNVIDSRKQLEIEVSQMKRELRQDAESINERVSRNVAYVKRELAAFEELLVEATKKPELPSTEVAPAVVTIANETIDNGKDDSNNSNESEDTNQSDEVRMSNPY